MRAANAARSAVESGAFRPLPACGRPSYDCSGNRQKRYYPTLLSTERNRHDVIEGKVLGRKLLPAVLTRVVVTRVNVGARELHTIEVLDAHIFKKPDD